ncbi:MAG: hypothetical protein FWE45_00945 [Firmicutes bacterium]|nr:hypothetical protein [Bacillota bacterium]
MKIQNIARLGGDLAGCDCDDILQRITSLEEGQCEQCCDCDAISQSLTELRTDVTTIQNDITEIQQNITTLEQSFNDQITNILNEISRIENFVFLSDVRTFPTTNNLLNGISVSTINAGHTFNFWGSGFTVDSPTLNNNTVYYIIDQSRTAYQIPELQWYQGDSTIGTLWIEIPGVTAVYSFPLRFDSSGIYFRTTQAVNNIVPGTLFKFTQALILVDPSTGG